VTLKISFLGAAGTVTGSRYLVETARHRVLIDCGLFQGFKSLRLKNWASFPVSPASVGGIVLTHSHIDHSGYLPLFAKHGYRGRVFCSAATAELCAILLPDAGHLEERYAEFANRHGFSKHKPALPLFTEDDARNALPLLERVEFHRWRRLNDEMEFCLHRAGHTIGAAMVELRCAGTTIVFSGDLGRFNDPLEPAPDRIERTDYLICESTYGNRRHDSRDPAGVLGETINATVAAGGTVLIPAFAVGRAQAVLFHLDRLKQSGRIPASLPVYLDSPMAQDATDIFTSHPEDHRLTPEQCRRIFGAAIYVRDMQASKALTADTTPKVILSASGMATGGRILHHLKRYAPDAKNAIVFTGFQAGGTRGAAMIAGADTVKIHGEYVPIRAAVRDVEGLSAHADADEILRWLSSFSRAPRTTFLTHGEPAESDALRRRIVERLGWNCVVPDFAQTEALS
jgi:metallo-beta-lactamase family protein